MRAVTAAVGSRGIDALTLVNTPAVAAGLKKSGVDFVGQYLGRVTPASVACLLEAGLAFTPITYADIFDPNDGLEVLKLLGAPSGCTVWLDVESVTTLTVAELQQKINAWASALAGAGYQPGVYVGCLSLLTSAELYALKVVRYWKSQSCVRARFNNLVEPTCGWCMYQLYPSVSWAGVWSDVNFVQQDHKGRLPVLVQA
jgi:hypothetical protein